MYVTQKKENALLELQNQDGEMQQILCSERSKLWELEGHIKKVSVIT